MKTVKTKLIIMIALPVVGGLMAMLVHRTALGIFAGSLAAIIVSFLTVKKQPE